MLSVLLRRPFGTYRFYSNIRNAISIPQTSSSIWMGFVKLLFCQDDHPYLEINLENLKIRKLTPKHLRGACAYGQVPIQTINEKERQNFLKDHHSRYQVQPQISAAGKIPTIWYTSQNWYSGQRPGHWQGGRFKTHYGWNQK